MQERVRQGDPLSDWHRGGGYKGLEGVLAPPNFVVTGSDLYGTMIYKKILIGNHLMCLDKKKERQIH